VHLWPKRRTSYTTWDSTSVGGQLGAAGPRRGRETVLADPLGLDTAGTAAGVRWVRLADGLPPVESVCFVGPGLLLLTGRHKRLGPATVWLQPLLPDGRPAPAVLA
jgi:hypothetical protein